MFRTLRVGALGTACVDFRPRAFIPIILSCCGSHDFGGFWRSSCVRGTDCKFVHLEQSALSIRRRFNVVAYHPFIPFRSGPNEGMFLGFLEPYYRITMVIKATLV